MNDMLHKLAIITVVYKNYTILTDYFASLNKQTDTDFRVYLADLSEEKQEFPYPNYVTYIPGFNKGYAHGINIAIKQAIDEGYDMFCVTNSDIELSHNFIANARHSLSHHPASLIGGKIYYSAGSEYHKDRYSKHDLGGVIWYAGGINDWNNCQTIHRGVDEIDHGQFNEFGKTEFITGCLMCFRKHAWDKIGSWNEDYFLYYEDADYCERAKRKKIPLYYDPSLIIWHKNAASTGGSGSKLHEQYQKKNQLIFGLKYAPWRTKLHLLKNYLSSFINSLCKCDE